jgi:outer membrane lipoprotein-sorting protein
MRYYFITFLILLSTFTVTGQKDDGSVKILDRFSAAALNSPSVSMNFKLVKLDQTDNSSDTVSGVIIISKDKYRLDLDNNITWFNGETTWSYLVAEKEVTITKANRKDNSFQSKPSLIFSMYKKGYKCRLIEEKSDVYIIDLYPEDVKSEFIRVRLIIGKQLLDLKSFEYKKRDGIIITILVNQFSLKQKTDASTFQYPADKFKGVEIVDMR